MAFRVCFVIGGFLFLIFTCHSAPVVNVNPILVASPTSDQKQSVNEDILKPSDTDKSSSVSPIGSTTTTSTSTVTSTLASERNDLKQKREITEDQIDLDEFFNVDKNENLYPYPTLNDDDDDDDKNENEHILFTDVKESPAKYDETLDQLDDKNLFSDLQMNPAELSTILHQRRRRRRRDLKLVDPLNQRRKRSLSSYDLYPSESVEDPWANFIDEQRYVRPLRSFAPIYWYPPVLERSVRSYDRNFWPIEFVNPSANDADLLVVDDDGDNDDDDDDEIPITIYEQDDSDDDYEPSRYPILMKSYSFPYDNLQYQTSYNTIASPIDDDEDSLAIIDENDENDDDDDEDSDDEDEFPILYQRERPSYMRYDPIENYIDV